MIPIPKMIFNQVALPLQILASGLAESFLGWIGVPVLRKGNVLELASQRLNVVEACSGIRSLLSLAFLALVYAYFFDSRPWMRVVLLLASVSIAILANGGRVAITGILGEYNTELAQGFFHSVEGSGNFRDFPGGTLPVAQGNQRRSERGIAACVFSKLTS